MQRLGLLVLALMIAGPVWAGRELGGVISLREQRVSDELLVRLYPGSDAAAVFRRLAPQGTYKSLPGLNLYVLKIPGGIPSGTSRNIATDLGVRFVEPNRRRIASLASPNDASFANQWALQTIQAARSWALMPNRYLTAISAGTGRIKIAVLDTGVDCTHPDFMNSGGVSADSANGGQLMFSGSVSHVATTISPAACSWQDDHGHGTHVAGIIAAAANNGIGVAGVAYPVQVLVYKVLDQSGSGTDSVIASAIMSAADAGVQVISMSFGGEGYSQTLQNAVEYAARRNVVIVTAAGNSATNNIAFPAAALNAIGVASTLSNNTSAGFSNYGDYVEIAAPGTSIYSTLPTYSTSAVPSGSGYGSLSGTSMSAPQVSAAAGLLAMMSPGVSATAIVQRLYQTASSNTLNGGWDAHLGYGVLNLFSAIAGTPRTATIGSVRGQVVDSSGLPITAQVSLNGQTLTTDPNTGAFFRFPAIPAGSYPITISASGFTVQQLTVTVAPGADTIVPVTMGVQYGYFTGTVTDLGVAVPYAIVQAMSGSLIEGTTVADGSGNYSLWLPAGTYSLRSSTISATGPAVTASLTALGTKQVNLTLARFGRITGTVTSSGQPVANAQVSITGNTFTAGAVTDAGGRYTTIGLPASTYSVKASTALLSSATFSNVIVGPDVDIVTNISFEITGTAAATATFVKTDTTTRGNWRSVYGADGYSLVGDDTSNPAYLSAPPALSGQFYSIVWTLNTSDTRALQKASNPSQRIAAAWYSLPTTFTVDLNISDSATHQLAIYCLDYDSSIRRQIVDVLDANNNVLNTQTLSSPFNGGVYLVWNVSGHVKLRFTSTGGFNAVVNGIFFR